MTGVALRAGAHATCLGAGVTRALLAEKSKHSEKRMLETMLDELSTDAAQELQQDFYELGSACSESSEKIAKERIALDQKLPTQKFNSRRP